MLKKAKKILGNEKGNVYLGSGFWIILIVFSLAVICFAYVLKYCI